ncbi:hypothetical protein OIE69_44000 (plasmid) [Actinacidiphila glaucinigra]|uniref:hypothetical protein n=1 Tax=Actinacidiphila glaucinigra TaxID=235986 RepID=UPI002DDB3BB6|nr:hypothetical protein [Actinacidiphila glaucinigra]WSD65869.1 hypothetical protein OIE69_44000 [Actinacidiphila glaucinigra]
MAEWGTRVALNGCWFSWKNLDDLVAIFEDVIPSGETKIKYSTTAPQDRDPLLVRVTETLEFATPSQLRTHLGTEKTTSSIQIERTAAGDPQKISFSLGGRFDWFMNTPTSTVVQIEGGSRVWEEGVADRVGRVLSGARFLGQRLTTWFTRLWITCASVAVLFLMGGTGGTDGLVGLGAAAMAIVLIRMHYWLTKSMVINEPTGVRKLLVSRSRNHVATSGPTPNAVVIGVVASIAGIISTVVALLDYFLPRS